MLIVLTMTLAPIESARKNTMVASATATEIGYSQLLYICQLYYWTASPIVAESKKIRSWLVVAAALIDDAM